LCFLLFSYYFFPISARYRWKHKLGNLHYNAISRWYYCELEDCRKRLWTWYLSFPAKWLLLKKSISLPRKRKSNKKTTNKRTLPHNLINYLLTCFYFWKISSTLTCTTMRLTWHPSSKDQYSTLRPICSTPIHQCTTESLSWT